MRRIISWPRSRSRLRNAATTSSRSTWFVLSTTVTVELNYTLKSSHTGAELWHNHQVVNYQPQAASSGGLGALIADAISAAMTKAAPNYVPLAQQANAQAINTKGSGLPAGPHDALYLKDSQDF